MSKGLRNMGLVERERVVDRRLSNKTGGLGYLAAADYRKRVSKGAKHGE